MSVAVSSFSFKMVLFSSTYLIEIYSVIGSGMAGVKTARDLVDNGSVLLDFTLIVSESLNPKDNFFFLFIF